VDRAVGIVGEAGVGKSRLLLQLTRLIPNGEYYFLEGKCLHYGSLMPYLPFLDILRSYFQIREDDGEAEVKQNMLDKVSRLEP